MKRWMFLCALTILLTACTRPQTVEVTVQWQPLLPLEKLRLARGVYPLRAPFATHDRQSPLVGYTAAGAIDYQIYDARLWPTDVIVVASEEDAPLVFLARSPHGGCLLKVDFAEARLADPCYGSQFDLTGQYLRGPSPRHLDRMPSEVRDGMIWVRNEIVYGGPHS
ncbi:hypothetical protein [Caldilinea sp.]|uniref:hypothetical protein n=1 Tax=Caldilinea sp. TaxID=2293560 RepID=UPI002BD04DD9|nr:hypothetical protein [Anaerolineales bacterium]HQY91891.1 hypothetical protein [Caldilinea sp.]HRA66348.1 hypothetical protein [Caldilinea sp.]